MFGGVGFLLNGNMCVGIWKTSLIVRLGRQQAEVALKEPHVVPFDITGRPMKGWAMVEADGLETDEQLSAWIPRALDFVKTHIRHIPCRSDCLADRLYRCPSAIRSKHENISLRRVDRVDDLIATSIAPIDLIRANPYRLSAGA